MQQLKKKLVRKRDPYMERSKKSKISNRYIILEGFSPASDTMSPALCECLSASEGGEEFDSKFVLEFETLQNLSPNIIPLLIIFPYEKDTEAYTKDIFTSLVKSIVE